jgi:hypothetical protein
VSDVADELRPPPAPVEEKIRIDIPQSARIWNYWMGGKDYYPIDREAGDAVIAVNPGIVTVAKQSRRFLIRAVSTLAAELGIRQFLDIGTGLPTMENTHEVAQSVAPESKIVSVDNDPLVLTHARALLTNTTPEGVTGYIDADIGDPDLIVADARNFLNFAQPIAVMFMACSGTSRRSVTCAGSSTGSWLRCRPAATCCSGTAPAPAKRSSRVARCRNAPRSRTSCAPSTSWPSASTGWRWCRGLASITQWRPEIVGAVGDPPGPIGAYGGMGRKP